MGKNFKGRLKACFAAVASSWMLMNTYTPVAASSDNKTEDKNNMPHTQDYADYTQDAAQNNFMENIVLHRHVQQNPWVQTRSCLKLADFVQNPYEFRRARSYTVLNDLYYSSDFARYMMNIAAERNVEVCDMQLARDVGGVYLPNENRLGLDFNRRAAKGENMAYLAHEFSHFVQFQRGAVYYDSNRSIYDNQRTVLAMEAAAPVAELIALMRASQNGVGGINRPFPNGSEEQRRYLEFRRVYDIARNNGLTSQEALNEASNNAWHQVLASQHKLNFYNDAVLQFVLVNIDNINPRVAKNYNDPSIENTVNVSGRFYEELDFTSNAQMPHGEALFGNNRRMSQLFEAVEWYRQSRIYGLDNQSVQEQRNMLRMQGNRFVDADFDRARRDVLNGVKAEQAISRAVRRVNYNQYAPFETYQLNITSAKFHLMQP